MHVSTPFSKCILTMFKFSVTKQQLLLQTHLIKETFCVYCVCPSSSSNCKWSFTIIVVVDVQNFKNFYNDSIQALNSQVCVISVLYIKKKTSNNCRYCI